MATVLAGRIFDRPLRVLALSAFALSALVLSTLVLSTLALSTLPVRNALRALAAPFRALAPYFKVADEF
ncbi:MAG: hypothetical protein ABI356_03550 [Steroidobacteraceae bacterium]